MLLKKVTIHKYKSFLTEQSYEVEPQITRIVGKNESGKTALLEALAKSNYFEDNTEFRFNKDLDYPRSELIKVRNENPPVLTCEYELSDEDISSVETAFAKGIIPRKNFCVTSFYDNTSVASGVEIDFTVFKDWLTSFFGLGDQGKKLIQAADSFSTLESVVSENAELPAMEQIKAQLDKIKTGTGDFEDTLEGYIYNTYLSPEIPKLWYFSDYSDTLFPLQAALGYTIAQNLYVSPKNLLVEGISDLVYLNHFSTILKDMGKEGLSENITIVPVGGADKIATFISLMRGNELSTVCLLDTFTDQAAQVRLKRMVEQKIIADKKILYYHSIMGQAYADIEDLFDKEEYLVLFNRAFGKSVQISELDTNKPIMSQLKRLNGNKAFNHYSPANYMAKNIGSLVFSDETMGRFEKLFAMVNSKFD